MSGDVAPARKLAPHDRASPVCRHGAPRSTCSPRVLRQKRRSTLFSSALARPGLHARRCPRGTARWPAPSWRRRAPAQRRDRLCARQFSRSRLAGQMRGTLVSRSCCRRRAAPVPRRTPPHAAIDLAVRWSQRDRHGQALRQARQRRAAPRGQRGRSHRGRARCGARSTRRPGCGQRWSAAYGEERAHAIAAAHLVEPPLDLTVKSDPERWARAPRRAGAADRQRAAPAQGAHRGAARLRRRRVVGAGRRGRTAGAAARRRRGQARRRSLRRARRQDGAARAGRRVRWSRVDSSKTRLERLARQSRAARP